MMAVATKVGPDAQTLKSRFETIAGRMQDVASSMEVMADEIEDLVNLSESTDAIDPHGLLGRCYEFLSGRAPATETQSCLVSDLARVLGR